VISGFFIQTHNVIHNNVSPDTVRTPFDLEQTAHFKSNLTFRLRINTLAHKSKSTWVLESVNHGNMAFNNLNALHKFVLIQKPNLIAQNSSFYNSTDKDVIKWSIEKDSGCGFIVSLTENTTVRLIILFVVTGSLGFFSISSLSKDSDADVIIFFRNPHRIKQTALGVLGFVYLVGIAFLLLNLAGGDHGIYIGFQIYRIRTGIGSFDLTGFFMNTNPAPGFYKIESGGV
jgi:hypothetical protein